MYFANWISFVLLIGTVAAVPTSTKRATTCTNPGIRKSWHKMTAAERTDYINAELCLMKKPTKLGLPGAKTRFDDMQAIHQAQAYKVHFVGAFFPFHRLYVFAHEQALRNECNYTGYQPYWNEPVDAGQFKKSILLDPVQGFGGDGSGTQGCIKDGPFKDYINPLGPGYDITNHCIYRQVQDAFSSLSSQAQVDSCNKMTTFATFWPCIENSPHGGGHGGVGGQMVNGVSSPGDPLFYLHHAWLDKLWWNWQAKDKTKRLTEIAGTNIMVNGFGFPPRPSTIPQPTGAPGDPGTTTTLQHILDVNGEQPNKTIAEVMDVQNGFFCYDYAEP